jgi:galactose mutarotase-like enzyme
MKFQNQNVVKICQGTNRILIDPQGGRLLLWEKEGRQIIYWPEEADWSKPTKIRGGNPVLFPFIARHMVEGKIGFWKDSSGVVREMPMHGFGREQSYQVETHENTCILTLEDSAATRLFYPYAFRFQIIYTLDDRGLEASLSTTNLSSTPLPLYPGHHFYFSIPHGERAEWEFAVDSVQQVRQNAEGLIYPQPSSPRPFRLSDPDLIDSMHVLSGQGPVLLRHRSSGRCLAIHLNRPDSAPWYAVTSWTEKPDSDFYCLEPWMGLPNAIHHGQGLRQLAPGQTEKGVCRMEAGMW